MPRLLLATATLLLLLAFAAGGASAEDDWVVRESGQSVAETVERLKEAITLSGSVVLATLDHQAAAEAAGFALSPTTVVMLASPRISTPLIQADPRVAIDLPLRILVWEENESTRLGYVAPAVLAERYGLEDGSAEIDTMTNRLRALVDAATRRTDARR